ncbi:MAG: AAA family ATPase [Actinomycetota bacterium]
MTEAPCTSSWRPIDLEPIVMNRAERPRPVILRRMDGAALLYPGRVHLLIGASEAGKTWIALGGAAEVLGDGGRVAFIDFESDERDIVGRLLELGVDPEVILDRFEYARPDESIETDPGAIARLVDDRPLALAVFDGVTEMAAIHGRDSRHEVDVATLYGETARPLARAGAAVLLLDHVPLGEERELGSQHKRAGVDVSLLVRSDAPWSRDRENACEVFRLKDRPAGLDWRPSGKRRKVAHVVASPAIGGGLDIVLYPPTGHDVAVTERREATKAQHRILASVTGEWEDAAAIAARVGLAERTAQQYLKALRVLDLVEARQGEARGAVVPYEYRLVGAREPDDANQREPDLRAVEALSLDPRVVNGAIASPQVSTARDDANDDANDVADDPREARRERHPGVRRTPGSRRDVGSSPAAVVRGVQAEAAET